MNIVKSPLELDKGDRVNGKKIAEVARICPFVTVQYEDRTQESFQLDEHVEVETEKEG